MAATKAYDPKFAEPGNEAFRRYVTIEYKPGNIRVTHLPQPVEADDTEPEVPYWLSKRGGGGPSGAPLPPAPAPAQSEPPHSSATQDPEPTKTQAGSLPIGETRATFPRQVHLGGPDDTELPATVKRWHAQPTGSEPPVRSEGSPPRSEASVDASGNAGEPCTRRTLSPTANTGRRRRRRA